ncbi:hypothetical protein CPB85DRAFT_104670 [Mucidula mucida]|nr:hypothetical protein CPB85DRAFT_104670 [Mucidula mucida]
MATPTDVGHNSASVGALPQEQELEKRQQASSQYSGNTSASWDWRLVRRDTLSDNPSLNMIVLRNPLTFSWPPLSDPSTMVEQSPRERALSSAICNAIPTPRKIKSPPAKYVSVPTPEKRRKRSAGDPDVQPVRISCCVALDSR